MTEWVYDNQSHCQMNISSSVALAVHSRATFYNKWPQCFCFQALPWLLLCCQNYCTDCNHTTSHHRVSFQFQQRLNLTSLQFCWKLLARGDNDICEWLCSSLFKHTVPGQLHVTQLSIMMAASQHIPIRHSLVMMDGDVCTTFCCCWLLQINTSNNILACGSLTGNPAFVSENWILDAFCHEAVEHTGWVHNSKTKQNSDARDWLYFVQ